MRHRALSAGLIALIAMALPGQLSARELVAIDADVQPGTILVRTSERKLYYVLGGGEAIRYPVAVGKPDKQWFGETHIEGKYVNPAWSPPADMKRDNPKLPEVIPGGSPRNPMGVRAMTLFGDEYAIHGTNQPGSIGTEASYGCIRMHNRDVVDLFERVTIGTPVVVTQ
jgi:lipoprotein-anchoring transpeptidase ErfK/SrfK